MYTQEHAPVLPDLKARAGGALERKSKTAPQTAEG